MDSRIISKIDEIFNKEFPFEDESSDEYDFEKLENNNNIIIPAIYKEFLLMNKYEYTKDDYFFPTIEKSSSTPADGLEFIDNFYSLASFFENSDEFMDLWCDYVLPIGEVAGDFVCIGVKEHNLEKIYMLNHDDEEREDGLYLIADSFSDFIMSFRLVDSN